MGESDGARQLKMQANQTGIESWEETREGWIKADVVFSNLPHVEANLLEPPPGQNPAYRDVDLFDVEEGVWRGASFLQSISEVENRSASFLAPFRHVLETFLIRKPWWQASGGGLALCREFAGKIFEKGSNVHHSSNIHHECALRWRRIRNKLVQAQWLHCSVQVFASLRSRSTPDLNHRWFNGS